MISHIASVLVRLDPYWGYACRPCRASDIYMDSYRRIRGIFILCPASNIYNTCASGAGIQTACRIMCRNSRCNRSSSCSDQRIRSSANIDRIYIDVLVPCFIFAQPEIFITPAPPVQESRQPYGSWFDWSEFSFVSYV